MITYKKKQFAMKTGDNAGKWYAIPVVSETYDLERLADHMSHHNTPFSQGVIKGVLADMVACIKELLLDGKSVKLDDLAIFTVRLRTKLADKPEDFKAATHIVGVCMRSRATGNLSNGVINMEANLRELGQYTVPGSGGTPTPPEGGGGSNGGGSDGGGDGGDL